MTEITETSPVLELNPKQITSCIDILYYATLKLHDLKMTSQPPTNLQRETIFAERIFSHGKFIFTIQVTNESRIWLGYESPKDFYMDNPSEKFVLNIAEFLFRLGFLINWDVDRQIMRGRLIANNGFESAWLYFNSCPDCRPEASLLDIQLNDESKSSEIATVIRKLVKLFE
jgi:hypothetical protein